MRFMLFLFSLFFGLAFNAQAAPAPAEVFGSLPKVYDAAISPTGKQIALIRVAQGQYLVQVITLGKAGEKPRLVSLSKGVKPISVVWANPDRLLVSYWQSEKSNGVPFTTGFIFSLDTKKMKGRTLVKPNVNVFRQYNHVVVDYLEDDPKYILMAFSKDDNNIRPDLVKVNVETGVTRRVRRGRSGVQEWFTDLRGEPRIGRGLKEGDTEDWFMRVRDADSNEWRPSEYYPGLDADVELHGFTGDPNELIIASYQGKDTKGLYIYSLLEKKITRKLYHNDTYDAESVILSQDGNQIVGAKFVGESTEVELFDGFASTIERLREQYPAHTVDFIDQSDDASLLIVKISNPYDPGIVGLYDARKEQLQPIADLYPKLTSDQTGEVISVKYKARDAAVIPGFLTIPPSITDASKLKRLPFIILPHGGPYGRDEKRFDYFAQFFANRGFGVLQMNFRGSTGYGKAFEEAGRENWVVMQDDVEDGARWLIEKGYADPERMCIAGWSYGGYAALMGALKTPDLYSCAISMAGVTDLQDMIRDIKKYRFGRISARNFILKGFDSKHDIRANSPVKLAGDLKVPLFLAHGTLDQRVHFDQFKRMKSALRKADAPVSYMSFKDEDHFLSNQENRIDFFEGLDTFLIETVGKSEFAP